MKPRFLLFCLAIGAVVLGACGDPIRPGVRLDTVEDTLAAFALNGTALGSPSALAVVGRIASIGAGVTPLPAVVRVDGNQNFEIAVDIDAAGRPVIYPLSLVESDLGTRRFVGVQRVAGSFESVLRAPGESYHPDSALVVAPGEVVIIEADQSGGFCQGSFARNIYAKMAIQSVNVAERTVVFRVLVDPNCGLRSLAPGRPAN